MLERSNLGRIFSSRMTLRASFYTSVFLYLPECSLWKDFQPWNWHRGPVFYTRFLHSPVCSFWKEVLYHTCGSIAHSNARVSEIDVVSNDFRSIIARLFPVQYKAHRGWVQVGIEGLLLQDTQRGDRVGGRGRCLAMDKFAIRPCTCWVKGLGNTRV